ncbi:HlyD family secretion protein [Hymenobacter elongatus]|uniref:HlyD family efflux transporter periplasmic adaptor subunit n=1 Tax=Hymenobacter elongatus TaxID=877208 RepID=A0A4Z0PEI1_9BACT|nr:HlyD family efflux transporter periplasmic adaptor subunit [Hymenobacter elongatus]TGE12625.1 HlyD family efflux transporter periplasmic adaptor subunit [Hymenobacter elongatus]
MDKAPLELRSEEVQDILSAMPGWLIRWGSLLIFGLLAGLLALAWLIKYPDTVTGEAVVTTEVEPVLLYSKVAGNLSQLHVREGQQVRQGQLLSEISSPIQAAQVEYLQRQVRQVEGFLSSGQRTVVTFAPTEPAFGEMQPTYNHLKAQLSDFAQLRSRYYQQTQQRLQTSVAQHRQLGRIYDQKLVIARRELANNATSFSRDQHLFREKVISAADLADKESRFNQRSLDAQNIREAFVQNQLALAQVEKQLQDQTFTTVEAGRKLRQGIEADIRLLENFVLNWRQNYAVSAPTAGRVVFLEKVSVGSYVETGKPLVALVAPAARVLAKVRVSAARYGKVRPGQKVRLELDNYPFQEYGFLYGTVHTSSYLPVAKTYELVVALPPQLISSYGQRLAYKPNMSGTAEVILEDERLLVKLLYFLRKLSRH